jgi:arginyl-tRNA synthetase
MEAAGYDVTREYYYNDAGRQVTLLGESVKLRYRQLLGQDVALDDEHYQGRYIIDIARELLDRHGDRWLDEPTDTFAGYAKDRISQNQRRSLKQINIEFDVYYREQSLYESGRVWEALEALRERGYVYQAEGAQWLKTTEFGDEKNRVLVKSTGEPTYRMPDIAYHWHKAQRGFDLVVDIFGPDHHATAPQVLMGVKALGYDPDFVKTVLHQIVSLIREGEQVKMSTRAGEYVTLDELVEGVGADPIRYFMISRSGNSPIDFDMDLAVEQSDKNPVYYIQNAHVRCAGIFRKWVGAGQDPHADEGANLNLLKHKNELNFLRKAMELPEVLEVTELMTGRDNLQIQMVAAQDEQITRLAERLDHYRDPEDVPADRLTQREDDRPEAARKRLEVYEERTAHVLRFYEGLDLVRCIDADGTIEEVYDRIQGVLSSLEASS